MLLRHARVPIGGYSIGAGWSSPVARKAHNLEVVSSNLTPATNCSLEVHYESELPPAQISLSGAEYGYFDGF